MVNTGSIHRRKISKQIKEGNLEYLSLKPKKNEREIQAFKHK